MDTDNGEDRNNPSWQRNGWRNAGTSESRGGFFRSEKLSRGIGNATYGLRQASSTYRRLSLLQRVLLACAAVFGVGVAILFLKFGENIFAWIVPLADKWRNVENGWALLWAATVLVSLPPLIGYSSCVMVAGFVYGMQGWWIVATATVAGSTLSFLLSRHVLSGFVHRLIAHDRRFNALALTLKHDGLKLLIMIRLCPLPYSLSNGAIATFPTVTWYNFAIATACATPKLLIAVFIGSRISSIANGLDSMDAGAKLLNWISIILGMIFGIAVGWFIYRQTRRRAQELEAQEGLQEVERYDPDDFEVGEDEEDEDERDHANGSAHGHGYSDHSKDESDERKA